MKLVFFLRINLIILLFEEQGMDSKLMDYDYLASRFQNLQLKTFLP